jgi:DNA-3-methyladenine glycosylase
VRKRRTAGSYSRGRLNGTVQADALLAKRATGAARLGRDAFNRPTLTVARDLLGKFIVHRDGRQCLSAMITEVEAYKGPQDLASHARGGRRTPRVEPLYCDGGTVYVYLVYGMHWLLNFSTVGQGKPECVLVRGVLAETSGSPELVAGPGRVTRHLAIDQRLTGVDITTSDRFWLEDRGAGIPGRAVRRGPRIGIDYAGPHWAARPWRFWIAVDPWCAAPARVSAPRALRGG